MTYLLREGVLPPGLPIGCLDPLEVGPKIRQVDRRLASLRREDAGREEQSDLRIPDSSDRPRHLPELSGRGSGSRVLAEEPRALQDARAGFPDAQGRPDALPVLCVPAEVADR